MSTPSQRENMTNETTEPTLYDAVAKLIKAKGRFHTEQNYALLVKAFDACKPAATAAPELTDAKIRRFSDKPTNTGPSIVLTDAEHAVLRAIADRGYSVTVYRLPGCSPD